MRTDKKTPSTRSKKTSAQTEKPLFTKRSLDELVHDANKSVEPLWMKLLVANREERKVTLTASALKELVSNINSLRGQIKETKKLDPPYVGMDYKAVPAKELTQLERYERLYFEKCNKIREIEDNHEKEIANLNNEITKLKVALSKEQRRYDKLWTKWYQLNESIAKSKKGGRK